MKDDRFRKTRFALLWTSLLNEPFLALYALLPFIFRKDVGASAFQIALLTTLRPVVSLISFYWSAKVAKRADRLRSNLVISGILARLPFLCVPFIHNVWFLIFASAIYMLFSRAGIPAWMEILKLNLPKEERERLFSLSSALGYAEGVLLALSIGAMLDMAGSMWKVLFFASALVGIGGVLIQKRIPVHAEKIDPAPMAKENGLLKPWKDTWHLMRSRPDFARFQWGFMAGGFGIMLVIAMLPLFFVDVLHLSHADFAAGRSICMGLGFVASSPFWGNALGRTGIMPVTAWVCIGFGLFPALLILAPYSLAWFYVAYFIYGIAQGGSHIVWHLSGPIFAGNEDSSQFSSVNVIMVGMRGMIAPFLGSLLYAFLGALPVLIAGMLLCFCGSWLMRVKIKEIAYGKGIGN